MSRKVFLVLGVLLLWYSEGLAQRKIKQIDEEKREKEETAKNYDRTSFWDKVRFGGNLGGGFGSGMSAFLIQPQAFYMVNDNFMTGVGFTYYYWSREYTYANGSGSVEYSDHSYGPNLFGRHRLFDGFFAQAEYSAMNFKSFNDFGETKRIWNHALFLGPGFVQEMGRGGTYIFVLYDILYNPDDFGNPSTFARNYRASPWDVRIGFFF